VDGPGGAFAAAAGFVVVFVVCALRPGRLARESMHARKAVVHLFFIL
jgi:hypothetical protein